MVQSLVYVCKSKYAYTYIHTYSTCSAKNHVIFRGGPLLYAYILEPYLNCVCKHDYVVTSINMRYSCINWYMCVIVLLHRYVP